MAIRPQQHRPGAGAIKTQLEVCLGEAQLPVGTLTYVKDGAREYSQFAYSPDWLDDAQCFDISPELQRGPGHQVRKAVSRDDSPFFLALADTEPDAWGRRVIARAHARRRGLDSSLRALNELDSICAVEDFSRIGALRLRDPLRGYLHTADDGARHTPPLLELEGMLGASRRVEAGEESEQDLRYLQGKGTSLGGLRPKCTVLDSDGTLALGKFPSIGDERSVTRGEVLALKLAALAGIDAAQARIEVVQGTPVAIVRRFDRTADQARIPYISGSTLLEARRHDEHAYSEILDRMVAVCADFVADARQLWRRLVFNHLITNVDDHLRNIGFLYVGRNRWRLAPAFDLNPFPGSDRESKTWLSEDTGPVRSIEQLLAKAGDFRLAPAEAKAVAREVTQAVRRWRAVGLSQAIGFTKRELEDFAPAFD